MNLEVALSITLVAVGLLLSIRHFRLTRTVSYIERFNSVDMIETRAKVDEWTASSTDDEERLRKLEENHLLNAHVKAFLNLLTELAIAHRYGLLIPEVTFQLWYPAVVNGGQKPRLFGDEPRFWRPSPPSPKTTWRRPLAACERQPVEELNGTSITDTAEAGDWCLRPLGGRLCRRALTMIRHAALTSAIASLPLSVTLASLAARLVAPIRLAMSPKAGLARALFAAVAIPSIATSADGHPPTAVAALEETVALRLGHGPSILATSSRPKAGARRWALRSISSSHPSPEDKRQAQSPHGSRQAETAVHRRITAVLDSRQQTNVWCDRCREPPSACRRMAAVRGQSGSLMISASSTLHRMRWR